MKTGGRSQPLHPPESHPHDDSWFGCRCVADWFEGHASTTGVVLLCVVELFFAGRRGRALTPRAAVIVEATAARSVVIVTLTITGTGLVAIVIAVGGTRAVVVITILETALTTEVLHLASAEITTSSTEVTASGAIEIAGTIEVARAVKAALSVEVARAVGRAGHATAGATTTEVVAVATTVIAARAAHVRAGAAPVTRVIKAAVGAVENASTAGAAVHAPGAATLSGAASAEVVTGIVVATPTIEAARSVGLTTAAALTESLTVRAVIRALPGALPPEVTTPEVTTPEVVTPEIITPEVTPLKVTSAEVLHLASTIRAVVAVALPGRSALCVSQPGAGAEHESSGHQGHHHCAFHGIASLCWYFRTTASPFCPFERSGGMNPAVGFRIFFNAIVDTITHVDRAAQSDEQLIAAVAGRDEAAFETLVRRHQTKALGLAYRLLGDADATQDIAQEAFLRVYRHADRFEPTARFTTWFYRIVVNLCTDHRRRRTTRAEQRLLFAELLDEALQAMLMMGEHRRRSLQQGAERPAPQA